MVAGEVDTQNVYRDERIIINSPSVESRPVSFPSMKFRSNTIVHWCLALVAHGVIASHVYASTTLLPDMDRRMAACISCHGKEGKTINTEYLPRIAGKPSGYLYAQLTHFRDGRRYNAAMNVLLEHLSDDYLKQIAAYFSALDLPYPTPEVAKVAPSVLARGQALAIKGDASTGVPACASCHGAALTGVSPAIPGLLGLPAAYMSAQLGAWRNGQRRASAPDCMASHARAISAEDVNAVAAWLAAQPVPLNGKPPNALPAPLPTECGGIPK
jgi:cytochrome c553